MEEDKKQRTHDPTHSPPMKQAIMDAMGEEEEEHAHDPPHLSPMKAVTREAYGGGMYGQDDNPEQGRADRAPASDTQSADGPVEGQEREPKHRPPPSKGDRDVDITGQSYIQ